MKKRIITGAVILAILVPAIYFQGIYFLAIGIFLSMVAAYEMMSMFYTKGPALKRYRYVVPVMSGIMVLLIYLATTKGLDQNIFLSGVVGSSEIKNLLYHFWVALSFMAFCIVIMGAMIFTKDSTAHDMMACILTLFYTGLIIGYVISIKYITPIGFSTLIDNRLWGGRSFAYLFTIAVITDTFAYLVGIRFGKHRLAPDISPKKSIEGAIAGLLAGGIVGTICAFLYRIIVFSSEVTPITKLWFIIAIFGFSLLISITVQIGDLVASKLKRSYNIKDYGKIFPGHGGVLDRFDSLIFSGAVYYIIVQFFQLVILGAL